MGATDRSRRAREPGGAPDRAGRHSARALRHPRLDVARPRRADLAELARPAPAALGDEGIPVQDPRPGQNSGSGSNLTPGPSATCRPPTSAAVSWASITSLFGGIDVTGCATVDGWSC